MMWKSLSLKRWLDSTLLRFYDVLFAVRSEGSLVLQDTRAVLRDFPAWLRKPRAHKKDPYLPLLEGFEARLMPTSNPVPQVPVYTLPGLDAPTPPTFNQPFSPPP